MNDELRRCAAYHEAGHAVVGSVLGRPLGGLVLHDEPINGAFGLALEDADEERPIREASRAGRLDFRKLVQTTAGCQAEARFLGGRVDPVHAYGDMDYLRACLHNAFGKTDEGQADMVRTLIEYASRVAAGVLLDHWSAVERVATALLERKRLDRAEIEELAK